ncbi:hypothetical protein [Microbacterium thalli]|uniref:Helix-turn-helix DNA binding domain protein n=1 Tax=Microbacterium thalli TaxID=3027921 RepID=A0ABT5SKG1_9MICO|nr:hypothetical protein [Microbacterium thalli]MDD7963323.1 hypothetical protein [Microbacterium thalli]
MSDRGCELGCKVPAEHWAACPWYGIEESEIPAVAEVSPLPVCSGCVPVPARDGVMICDRCYRRLRGHIDNAADLVGRLRSLADPRKAMVYDAMRSSPGKGAEAPAPTPADLIDASEDVMRSLRSWAVFVDPRSGIVGGMPAGAGSLAAYDYARSCANVILGDFDRIANHADDVQQLAEAVLVRHPVDEDGVRPFWSIVDAVSRYRLERPDAAHIVDTDADEALEVSAVAEWRDRLITKDEAARAKYAGSERTLKRWREREGLVPRAITQGPMGRVTWFRESEVLATRDRVRSRVGGRPRRGSGSPLEGTR